jgi:hypothetical protein
MVKSIRFLIVLFAFALLFGPATAAELVVSKADRERKVKVALALSQQTAREAAVAAALMGCECGPTCECPPGTCAKGACPAAAAPAPKPKEPAKEEAAKIEPTPLSQPTTTYRWVLNRGQWELWQCSNGRCYSP